MKEEVRKKLEKCNTIEEFERLSVEEVNNILQEDTSDILTDNNTFLGRKQSIRFEVFNLPQGISCPEATAICRNNCYQITPEGMLAAKDCDSAVLAYRKMNLLKSLQDNFADNMVAKILRLRPNEGENIIIRIHASGDFYSPEYMRKWFEIALRTYKAGKTYKFVAYTKSINILKSVMEDRAKLDDIYIRIFGQTLEKYEISDFNIMIIGSIMDDTCIEKQRIIDNYNLPKYIVTKDHKPNLKNCEEKTCANCMECYKESMKTIITRLR